MCRRSSFIDQRNGRTKFSLSRPWNCRRWQILCRDIKSAMHCSLRLNPTMINHLTSVIRICGCSCWGNYDIIIFKFLCGEGVASSPGSLLKNGGRREPGNIRGKSCRLPAPCSGGTNQIAERNHVYTWHFVHSAKKLSTRDELISAD